MTLRIIPITLRTAAAFIAEHHRHNKPPRGWKFGMGLVDDWEILRWRDGDDVREGKLVGVITAGRPIARALDDGLTLEVNRSCTDGTPNANSMLYGAVWRAAKAMGYQRCITYTQADESGASLRAAGWVKVKELSPRGSWASSTGDAALKAMRDEVGNGGVARVMWECAVRRGVGA